MWKCKVNKADYHELLKNVLKIEDIKYKINIYAIIY